MADSARADDAMLLPFQPTAWVDGRGIIRIVVGAREGGRWRAARFVVADAELNAEVPSIRHELEYVMYVEATGVLVLAAAQRTRRALAQATKVNVWAVGVGDA